MAKVTVSLTLDDRADRDIIAWLDKTPKRQKSAAIREAIRKHLRASVTLGDVYEKLIEIERKLAAGAVVVGAGGLGAVDFDEPADVAAALDTLGI